jgi:hypothetical protein
MDGALLRHHVAAYRLIPYVQRQDLDAWADKLESGIEAEDGSSSSSSEGNKETKSPSSSSDSLV